MQHLAAAAGNLGCIEDASMAAVVTKLPSDHCDDACCLNCSTLARELVKHDMWCAKKARAMKMMTRTEGL